VAAGFTGTAAGEKGDDGAFSWQIMGLAEGGGGGAGMDHAGERMTCICSVDAMIAEPGFFEREEAKEFGDEAADGFDAALTPGPDLRGDEIEDGDAHFLEMAGKAEVEIWVVREDGGGGWMGAGVAEESAVLTVDAREVRDDFGQADDGEAGGVNDRKDALGLEFGAGAAEELGVGEGFAERGDEGGGVHVARGFAGGDEKGGLHV
jgi:hypothetical protein